jgi:hypothetical protein
LADEPTAAKAQAAKIAADKDFNLTARPLSLVAKELVLQ